MKQEINCKVDCVNGCINPDSCPSKEDREKTSQFISETSLDKMIEIAEIARLKKLSAPPKWVIPDEFSN